MTRSRRRRCRGQGPRRCLASRLRGDLVDRLTVCAAWLFAFGPPTTGSTRVREDLLDRMLCVGLMERPLRPLLPPLLLEAPGRRLPLSVSDPVLGCHVRPSAHGDHRSLTKNVAPVSTGSQSRSDHLRCGPASHPTGPAHRHPSDDCPHRPTSAESSTAESRRSDRTSTFVPFSTAWREQRRGAPALESDRQAKDHGAYDG